MTSQTFKLDCSSPLINYQPLSGWQKGGADGDPFTSRYDNGTFMFATQANTSFSFNFTGTSIQIIGAIRSNHGPFSVQLDDGQIQTFNLNNPPVTVDKQLFQQTLFSQDDLSPGPHTVTVTNMPSGNMTDIDIDYLSFTASYDPSHDVRVQSDVFQFNPPAAWTRFVDQRFDQGSGDMSSQSDASATITFNGTYVSLFGAIGDTGAPYTVQLDNGTVQSFNGLRSGFGQLPQQMLYHADSISAGVHQLVVTTLSSVQSDQQLSLDYVIVNGSVNEFLSGSATTSSLQSSVPLETSTKDVPASTRPTSLSAGIIAGVAISSLVAILLLMVIFRIFLFRRWRTKQLQDDASRPRQCLLTGKDLPLSMQIEPYLDLTPHEETAPRRNTLYSPATDLVPALPASAYLQHTEKMAHAFTYPPPNRHSTSVISDAPPQYTIHDGMHQ